MRLEGWGALKQLNDSIGTGSRDLPAFSILPQPTTLPRVNHTEHINILCGQNEDTISVNAGNTDCNQDTLQFQTPRYVVCETGPRLAVSWNHTVAASGLRTHMRMHIHTFIAVPYVAQAVSRWLFTVADRVRSKVRSCGIVMDRVTLDQVLSE
jgi:hypothetical protein